MTEAELIEAMDRQCPVVALTILNGEIEYRRVVSVIRRRGSEPGKYEIFAELESLKDYQTKPVEYPAGRIRLKEQGYARNIR